jgi:4'-phosphopantetheinyl transferase
VFEAPPARLAIGEVHVWRLTGPSFDLLSESERERAEKFRSEPARTAFATGRAGLRQAAAIYSGIDPRDLVISQKPEGKPFFENLDLHFNLSHSDGEIVAAFSEAPVGIDIESPGRSRDFHGIARRFFHPDEAALISGESDFLRVWTAKEAMLKLAGTGLAGGLHEARSGPGGMGILAGRTVWIEPFCIGRHVCTLASFHSFAVKGWFQI